MTLAEALRITTRATGRGASSVRHRDHRRQRRPLHTAGRGNPHPAEVTSVPGRSVV